MSWDADPAVDADQQSMAKLLQPVLVAGRAETTLSTQRPH